VILAHLAHQAALGMYFFQDSGQTVGLLSMDLWHNWATRLRPSSLFCFPCPSGLGCDH